MLSVLTVDDFPDSFKENRVFIEPIAFGSAAKIAKAYSDFGVTPEIITNLLENGTVEDSDWGSSKFTSGETTR